MILLVAAQKGGVGKSTTAVNIAAVLAQQGHEPLLFDADEQPTATQWWAERGINYPEHPKVHSRQAYGDIHELLPSLDHDFIIVDAAGHDSVEMRSAMSVCDVLLIPFRPSQPDLNTLPHMSLVISKAQSINPDMKAFAFLSIAPTNHMLKSIEESKQAIAEFGNITLVDAVIYERSIYSNCMSEGLGVVEMVGNSPSVTKAKTEITNLVKEVLHG